MIALLLALTAQAGVVDKIAAIVDDEVIALSEVYELGGDFITENCPPASPPTSRRPATASPATRA